MELTIKGEPDIYFILFLCKKQQQQRNNKMDVPDYFSCALYTYYNINILFCFTFCHFFDCTNSGIAQWFQAYILKSIM